MLLKNSLKNFISMTYSSYSRSYRLSSNLKLMFARRLNLSRPRSLSWTHHTNGSGTKAARLKPPSSRTRKIFLVRMWKITIIQRQEIPTKIDFSNQEMVFWLNTWPTGEKKNLYRDVLRLSMSRFWINWKVFFRQKKLKKILNQAKTCLRGRGFESRRILSFLLLSISLVRL